MVSESPTGRVPTGSSKVPPEGCVRAYSGHARAGVCCYVRVMWFGAVYARALVCVGVRVRTDHWGRCTLKTERVLVADKSASLGLKKVKKPEFGILSYHNSEFRFSQVLWTEVPLASPDSFVWKRNSPGILRIARFGVHAPGPPQSGHWAGPPRLRDSLRPVRNRSSSG